MISITKAEKEKLVGLFPPERPPHYKFPRTMAQDSKRHHYYCTEAEELMRAIADTNMDAAKLVVEYDRRNELRRARQRAGCGGANGGPRKS